MRRRQPPVSRRRTLALAGVGAAAFWLVNFAISLTPIAAEYRAANSIPYVPMLLQALAGGLVIGLGVAYLLQRFFDRIPVKSPVLKALLLSGAVLVAVTMLVEAPAKLVVTTPPDLGSFLAALLFNVLRVLALGVAIGAADSGRTALDPSPSPAERARLPRAPNPGRTPWTTATNSSR